MPHSSDRAISAAPACAVTPRDDLHRIRAFAVAQRRSSKCRDFRSRQPGVPCGKLTASSTIPLVDRESLSVAYPPGVAEVCMAIADDISPTPFDARVASAVAAAVSNAARREGVHRR